MKLQSLHSYSHPATLLNATSLDGRECTVTLYRERMIVPSRHHPTHPLEIYCPCRLGVADGPGVASFDGRSYTVCGYGDNTKDAMRHIDREHDDTYPCPNWERF